jgi:hypothetical protein
MANRTGTKLPAELMKNPYSQKQKNLQKDYYTEHLAPYLRKGLDVPEELLTRYYEIALDLVLQALELDIRRMFYLVYDQIEKRPHKRELLLKYANSEKKKIEKQMEEAKAFYTSRPQVIVTQTSALKKMRLKKCHEDK